MLKFALQICFKFFYYTKTSVENIFVNEHFINKQIYSCLPSAINQVIF